MKSANSTRQRIIGILFICVCAVYCAAILGLEIRKETGAQRLTPLEEEDLDVPQNFQDEATSFDVIFYKTIICVNLFRSFIGMLLGILIGLCLVFIMRKKLISSQENISRDGVLSVKNVLFTVAFLLLFGIIWYVSVFVTIRKLEPLPEIRFKIIAKYLALLSIVISWLLVGRKIRIGQSISRVLNWLLLGPFNYIRLSLFNSQQQKILWIGIVLIVFLVLFPPWNAYWFASGDKGHGDSEFIGFHFVFSSQYDVLYDAPYIVAEVDNKMRLLLIVGITICTFLCVLYLDRKSHRLMDQTDGIS